MVSAFIVFAFFVLFIFNNLTNTLCTVKEIPIEKHPKIFRTINILLTILLPWFGSAQNYLDNAGVGPKNYIDQYTPAGGQNDLENVCNHEVISDGSAAILNPNDIISKPNELIFKGQLIDNAVSLDLPTYNYKNIRVYRDGKKINWKPSVNDTVTIHTSKLSGPVTVKYVPSFIDWLGIIVSIGTWVVGIVYYFRKKIISE